MRKRRVEKKILWIKQVIQNLSKHQSFVYSCSCMSQSLVKVLQHALFLVRQFFRIVFFIKGLGSIAFRNTESEKSSFLFYIYL